MPQYMLLIYNSAESRPTPEQLAEDHPKWMQYTQDLQDAGVFVHGDALQGADVATTVREQGGEIQLTDGPFAETKEYLGGYYVIDVPDLDKAIEYASRMPNLYYGSVEVRPTWDPAAMAQAFDQAGAEA